jgi:hypothetical protein
MKQEGNKNVQIAADILIHRSESDQAVNFDIYAFE